MAEKTPAISPRLKAALARREHIFRSMEILYDLAKDASAKKTLSGRFGARYAAIVELKDKIYQLTDEIVKLQDDTGPADDPNKSLEAFDDLYYAVVEIHRDLATNSNTSFHQRRALAETYLDSLLSLKVEPKTSEFNLIEVTYSIQKNVNALKGLLPGKMESFISFYLAFRVLDYKTRQAFDEQNAEEFPTFDQLMAFLNRRVQVLEASRLPPPPKTRKAGYRRKRSMKL